jgi:DNA (cytosine-5)-methyltransferase 1
MLTMFDMFAGIGGFRMAFERAGFKCAGACEIDRFARCTYLANFSMHGSPFYHDAGTMGRLPQFDVLCAGFPCQPWSISGESKLKSLGRPTGWDDERAGLFGIIVNVLRQARPRAFLLENVPRLAKRDKGAVLKAMVESLNGPGYGVRWFYADARHHVPQARTRLFILGLRDREPDMPNGYETAPLFAAGEGPPVMRDILERRVPDKYFLSDHLWNYLQEYREKHRRAGNGFGYGLVRRDGVSRTLSARYYKDGSEILVPVRGRKTPRRLTPRECVRLMGFPDDFKIPVSDTQAYRQFGNAVVVPVVERIARMMRRVLNES